MINKERIRTQSILLEILLECRKWDTLQANILISILSHPDLQISDSEIEKIFSETGEPPNPKQIQNIVYTLTEKMREKGINLNRSLVYQAGNV